MRWWEFGNKSRLPPATPYFFRYVIVQENMGRETIVSEPQILAVHDRLMSVVREIGQIETKITQGKHTRQIASYQLYLSQTKSYPVGGSLPIRFRRTSNAIWNNCRTGFGIASRSSAATG